MRPLTRTVGIGAMLALAAGLIGCATTDAPEAPEEATASIIDVTTDPTILSYAEPTHVTPYLTWVVQGSDGPPMLCIGPRPRPAPTACDGVALIGWDWDAAPGEYGPEGSVRRGEFIVAGEYSSADNTLAVAWVDANGPEGPQVDVCPDGSAPLPWRERPIFDEIASQFVADTFDIVVPPGYSDECGRLTIGVAHDDGSITAALEDEFGTSAGLVDSALVRASDSPMGDADQRIGAGSTVHVGTQARTLVIDGDGDGDRPPHLCVGLHQQSLPPDCFGVHLVGWDWAVLDGTYEQQGAVRWGEYFVDGEYSREDNTLTVTRASADGFDIGFEWRGQCADGPLRADGVPPAETKAVMTYVEEDLGVAAFGGSTAQPCAVVDVLVAYDDGSIQAEIDDRFGDETVRVVSALALRE